MKFKKAILLITRVLTWIILLLVSLNIILYLTILLPPVQKVLHKNLESFLDSALTGKVSIGSIQIQPFTNATALNVQFFNTYPPYDTIKIQEITASLWLPSLLYKTITIKSVNAQNLSGTITIFPQKNNTLPFLPVPKTKHRKQSSWKVALNSAYISNVNIIYMDSVRHITASVQKAATRFFFPKPDSVLINVTIPVGKVSSPWWSGSIDTLYSQSIFSSNNFQIDSTLLVGSGTTVFVKGSIPVSDTANWNITASVQSTLYPLTFLKTIPGLSDTGNLQSQLSLQGSIRNPDWKYTVNSNNVYLYSILFKSLSITGSILDSSIRANARFISPGLSGTAQFNAIIDSLLYHQSIKQYSADISVDTITTKVLHNLNFSFKDLPKGFLSIHAIINGSSVEWPGSIKVNASFNTDQFTDPITANATMIFHDWSALVQWGNNSISGQGTLNKNGAISGTILSQINQPSLVASLFTNNKITGSLNAISSLSGSINNPAVVSHIKSTILEWKSIKMTALSGTVIYTKPHIRFKDIQLFAEGPLHNILQNFSINNANGYALVKAIISGTPARPVATGSLFGTNLFYHEYSADTVSGTFSLTGFDTVSWYDTFIRKGLSLIETKGFLHRNDTIQTGAEFNLFRKFQNIQESAGAITIQGAVSGKNVQFTYKILRADISIFKPWIPVTPFNGILDAQGTVLGTINNPEIKTEYALDHPVYNNYTLQKIKGSLSLQDSQFNTSSSLFLKDSISEIRLSGKIPVLPSSGWEIDTSGNGRSTVLHFTSIIFDLAGLHSFFPDLFSAHGPGSIDITVSNTHGPWNLNGRFSAANSFINYIPLHITAGNVSVNSTISGTILLPRIAFSAKTGKVHLQSGTVISSFWKGVYHGDTISLDSGLATFENGGYLQVSGDVPIVSIDTLLSGVDPDLQFKLKKVPLNIIQQFLPGVTIKNGTLEGRGKLVLKNGRLFSNGTIHLENGTFSFDNLEKAFGPLNGDFILRGDSLIIKQIQGKLGGGTVSISGFSALRPGGLLDLALHVKAKDASFLITDLIDADIQSADLTFNSNGSGYELNGTVKLGDTRIIRDVRISNFIKTNDITPVVPRKQDPFMQNVKLKVKIELQENLFIDMNLGNMQLDGQIAVSGTLAQPNFTGDISIIDGYIYYLDRQLDITHGVFTNYDPFQFNPSINLTATSDVTAVAAGTAQTVLYAVTLTIAGTLDHPTVTLTSSPPLSEPDIISVMTLGTTLGAVSGDLASRIGSLVGQEIIGLGTRKLERLLNLQSITISGNVFNSSSSGGPQITLTKRFTNRLTVSYTSSLRGVYRQKVSAILRLFPFLFIIGETDEYGNANINLNFKTNR